MNNTFSFSRKARPADTSGLDSRYRLTIMLIAEKRPRYWQFHCPVCTWKVCELSGALVGINDGADINAIPDYQPAPLVIRCRGRDCKTWFEFTSLSSSN